MRSHRGSDRIRPFRNMRKDKAHVNPAVYGREAHRVKSLCQYDTNTLTMSITLQVQRITSAIVVNWVLDTNIISSKYGNSTNTVRYGTTIRIRIGLNTT